MQLNTNKSSAANDSIFLEIARMIDFSQIASLSCIILIISCKSNEVKPNWTEVKQNTPKQTKPCTTNTKHHKTHTSVLSFPFNHFFKSQQNKP